MTGLARVPLLRPLGRRQDHCTNYVQWSCATIFQGTSTNCQRGTQNPCHSRKKRGLLLCIRLCCKLKGGLHRGSVYEVVDNVAQGLCFSSSRAVLQRSGMFGTCSVAAQRDAVQIAKPRIVIASVVDFHTQVIKVNSVAEYAALAGPTPVRLRGTESCT